MLVIYTRVSLQLTESMAEINFGGGYNNNYNKHNHNHHNYGVAIVGRAAVSRAPTWPRWQVSGQRGHIRPRSGGRRGDKTMFVPGLRSGRK